VSLLRKLTIPYLPLLFEKRQNDFSLQFYHWE
jgi:hypothetical protein